MIPLRYFGWAAAMTVSVFLFANYASALSIFIVPQGGTGWANIQSGAIPYGNGTSRLATTTQGTGGQVLAWLNGIPSWAATTTLSTISGTLSLSQLATQAANTVVANGTGATAAPTAIATSSIYLGSAGQILAKLNGIWVGVATTTFSCSGTIACPFASGAVTFTSTGIADPFTHPAALQSATTSLMIFSGQASTTNFSTSLLVATSTFVMGTTSPFAGTWLSLLVASSTIQLPTAFSIASTTTSGATTSLFSINSIGTVNSLQINNTNGATTSSLFVNGSSTIATTLNTANLTVTSAGGSAGCATFSSTGLISNTGSACGTGAGGGDPFTHPAVGQSASTSLMIFSGGASSTFVSMQNLMATGTVAIGTTSPFAGTWLSLLIASSSTQLPTAFDISSTTVAGATTSLFSVDSLGTTSVGTLRLADTGGNGLRWTIRENETNDLEFNYPSQRRNILFGSRIPTKIGLGTSTPWALLSIGTSTPDQVSPFFQIASSTETIFQIASNGSAVLGTTTPFAGTWFSLLVGSTSKQLPTAFNIASTGTSGATTSLFAITATGTAQTLQLFNTNGATTSALFVNGSTTVATTLNASTLNLGNALTVPSGGTGAITFTTNGVLYGNTASAIQVTSQGAANSVLTANAGAPSFSAAPTIGTSVTTPLFIASSGGSASAPAFTISGDTNNGIFSSAADVLNFATNAIEAARFTAIQNLLVGTTTANPFSWVTFASSTPVLSLTDTNAGTDQKHILIGNYDGVLRIGTSTDALSSTSTALSLDPKGSPIIGVGTSSPYARLAVHLNATDAFIGNIFALASSTASATTTFMRVSNTGTLFLPALTQSAANQTYYACGVASTFEMVWDTTTCLVSALKFKRDIHPLTTGLDAVLKMKPVTYYKKEPLNETDAGEEIGFIADWSVKIVPQLVTYDKEGDVHGFNYEQYTAVLTKALQQFYAEFQNLIARVSGLEERVDKQQKEIDDLRGELDKLKNKMY